MTDRVIQASFVDFKNVKTRSVFQIVLEVDISRAQHVLQLLGYPDNSKDIPVAVAKLAPSIENPRQVSSGEVGDKPESPKSYAGQAKMLAKDDGFSAYKTAMGYAAEDNEEWLKGRCGIISCSEIMEGTEAGKKFKRLQADYLRWKETPPISAYET